MGKSPKSSQLLHHHSTLSSKSLKTTIKPPKPSFQNHLSSCRKQLTSSVPLTLNLNAMEEEEQHRSENGIRVPLSQVVSDCVKRWFSDTLKEAKSGDINMQVLVGQMYYNGYGVSKDAQKGSLWMTKASRVRSSVWKVSNKRPGYNASDSDSDELIGYILYSNLDELVKLFDNSLGGLSFHHEDKNSFRLFGWEALTCEAVEIFNALGML
ncbi:hypothetical protein M9H77_22316 [Catharanthus roseus]|uniref:Uncharacterized protein n=1 Tax=Catharanthus roseus TaxID=4058 RepID=A0ACC0AU63_CATRO|nr:hypothetical protein M9H77_22316 [Catharanthus roseus]